VHLIPQPPQLFASLPCTSRQAPLHAASPLGQLSAQALPLQLALPPPLVGAGQLVAHFVPQLFGSAFETHFPPQRCVPWLHWMPQVAPPVHVASPAGSVGHTCAHEPQCFGSDVSSTHAPLHNDWPPLQPDAHANVVPASSVFAHTGVVPLQLVVQFPHSAFVSMAAHPSSGFVEQIP